MRKQMFKPDEFSKSLRVAIAERNLDMLRAAKEIGCSHSSISRICNGKSPDVENYLKIQKWLSKAQAKPSTSRVSG